MAIIPDDVDGALRDLSAEGFEVASTFRVAGEAGFDVYFVDTRPANGHMIEVYGNVPPVRAAYDMVKEAAAAGGPKATVTPIQF